MATNPFGLSSIASTKCCNCGVWFSSPILSEREIDKKSFYCPNGHPQHYLGEPLSTTIKRLESDLSHKVSQLWSERSRADAAESRVKQFASGKCPCCQQKFRRLREHMKRKHPRFN